MTNDSVAPRESARPATLASADVETDVVVVGGGGAGLPTALFSRWLGNEVVLLEKAPELGGTAKKAAFWYWVPNNEPMRALGIEDRFEDFLRYVARLSQPTRFDPVSPTAGLTDWEASMARAFYDSASPAAEWLAEQGALTYRHCPDVPDYWSELAEDKAPKGRVLVPEGARESMSDGGEVAIAQLSAAAARDGVDVRTGHRVQRLVVDGGRVAGVEATTAAGQTVRVLARKGVVFATGGFSHDDDLRRDYLGVPAYPGCAAVTNEGDFVRISSSMGAQFATMNHAWMCPVPLEKSGRPDLVGMFSVAGDSMILVNRRGMRVANEKQPYNESARTFFQWDPAAGNYPNLVLVQVWDQRSQDHSASDEYGRLIVPPGTDDSHVISARTLDELTVKIRERLAANAAKTGGFTLADDFAENLPRTIDRFNGFAAKGKDEDFARGETAIQLVFNGPVKEEPGRDNPTMWPISDTGPYYAALVTGGLLDTKGGPRTDPDGRVLDDLGVPVPGLFGVGNCVASSSGRAYWAGGATLGPIIAFAYRAAGAVDRAPGPAWGQEPK
ncbi:FAD-dependent oxidoreductase [Amycolatopsis carbonis]|uniref:FAD-dependent oxidoreductase n=1 Tax=Amycolatopsis carbonis TaxID=715471 RepID=A0A9Y2MUJ3_9PSEU|nr:FAD-dependent oxidoreductase [Amycolatopsis sp. 2-15]WIX77873.1 FAD-dependent oxidoreductase [Amycolatopsis sp. 2-15]